MAIMASRHVQNIPFLWRRRKRARLYRTVFRRTEMKIMRLVSVIFVASICVGSIHAATESAIRGTVTDNNGKPIRGALVRVQSGYKIVTRYSQNDGRYEISVQPGDYSVTADAFGYNSRRDAKVTAPSAE